VLEAEHRLAGAGLAVFALLQLFHLHHQLALPRIAERRAGLAVLIVRETHADSCTRLYDYVLKGAHRAR
jgi:hypothetical protein